MIDFTIEKGSRTHLGEVTRIINSAYRMWHSLGFHLKDETEEQVGTVFLKDGYVALSGSKVVACFCIRMASLSFDGSMIGLQRANGDWNKHLPLPEAPSFNELKTLNCSYFYALAVDPVCSQKGLGRKMVGEIIHLSREWNCRGVLLESGKKADWLVNWYERLGFQIIGEGKQGNGAETVFMLFRREL